MAESPRRRREEGWRRRREVTSHRAAPRFSSAAPLLHFPPRRHTLYLLYIARKKKRLDPRRGGKPHSDTMNNSFPNMASIGDIDPLNPSIPATKVEITVSCR